MDQPPSYTAYTADIFPVSPTNPVAQSNDEHLLDEVLPDYAPPNVPIYEEPDVEEPTFSYIFHQTSRKMRSIIPDDLSSPLAPSYLVTARSGPRFFSKRPDLTLSRIVSSADQRRSSTASANSMSSIGTAVIAEMKFVHHTNIPWYPRLSLLHLRNPISPQTYILNAPNFYDFAINIDQRNFIWKLTDHPSTSLILLDRTSDPPNRIMARFAYSQFGTDAVKGQQMGRLDIYDIEADGGPPGMVEIVIASCELVVQHWRGMGKHFKNSIQPSRCTVMRLGGGSLAQGGFGSFAFAGYSPR